MDAPLKAIIVYHGDESVGIFDETHEMELPISTPEVRQDGAPHAFLNKLRKKIEKAYRFISDEPFTVTFNMECPDCGNIWGEHNKGCPNLITMDEVL